MPVGTPTLDREAPDREHRVHSFSIIFILKVFMFWMFSNVQQDILAIPEQRLDRGAGEVSSRTTAETGNTQTDLRGCLTAKPERMTQVPQLTTYLPFLPRTFRRTRDSS